MTFKFKKATDISAPKVELRIKYGDDTQKGIMHPRRISRLFNAVVLRTFPDISCGKKKGIRCGTDFQLFLGKSACRTRKCDWIRGARRETRVWQTTRVPKRYGAAIQQEEIYCEILKEGGQITSIFWQDSWVQL